MQAVVHAIAAPRRQELLRLCWASERAAGDLHRAMPDVTFGAVSQHLGQLVRAGLLTARRDGRRRLYRARPRALGPLRQMLEAMWSDALWQLKLQAELEAARRGPRRSPRRRAGNAASPARGTTTDRSPAPGAPTGPGRARRPRTRNQR